VAEHRLVTVEDLQRMSPEERLDLLKERTATDLSQVDPEFLARAKADALRVLEARQAADSHHR
jgi:hypothetical protein